MLVHNNTIKDNLFGLSEEAQRRFSEYKGRGDYSIEYDQRNLTLLQGDMVVYTTPVPKEFRGMCEAKLAEFQKVPLKGYARLRPKYEYS